MGNVKQIVWSGLCTYPVGQGVASWHCQGDGDETWSNVAALPAAHNQTRDNPMYCCTEWVAVLSSNEGGGDPSCWEGQRCQLTSRPSLRHLVSWVLVLIHDRAVYLLHWEAS
jgi:hypothetical protein